MAFSDFTLEAVCRSFSLDPQDAEDVFSGVPSLSVSPFLRAVLAEFAPLATTIHTEKARSEFIVAPILAEARRLLNHRISLFSGIEFNVDFSQGLSGVCDFLLAASPVQSYLNVPVMPVVEAKKDDIKAGLGQCVAEMVAARLFNERERQGPTVIHGAVTTGSVWKFLRLDGGTVFIDRPEYYLDQVDKVLGVLVYCVGGDASTIDAAA
jgi:hypothetical protein